MSGSGVAVQRAADGVSLLVRDLQRIPVELRKELRPRLTAAGNEVLGDARANAAWSSRIPGALTLRVSFAGDRAGVYIEANAKRAPHARVYEGLVADVFRHPVFARRGRSAPWVAQAARPFLLPAARGGFEAVVDAVDDAIDTVLTQHGFGR